MLFRSFPCTDAVSVGLVMLYIAGLTSLVLGEVILIFMILAAVPIVARLRLVLPKLPKISLHPAIIPPIVAFCCYTPDKPLAVGTWRGRIRAQHEHWEHFYIDTSLPL